MFSFGYDVTQIFRHLPYPTVWEILKRETYPDKQGRKRSIGHSPVLWRGYAISLTPGKCLELWKLVDPDKPYKGKQLSSSAHIKIYDVFGFFQSSFRSFAARLVEPTRSQNITVTGRRSASSVDEDKGGGLVDFLTG
jgi:hypothetical protein